MWQFAMISWRKFYLAWNKPDQAESYYNQSVAMVEKIGGAESYELPGPLMGLAAPSGAQKKYAAAENAIQGGHGNFRENAGPEAAGNGKLPSTSMPCC